MIIYIYIILLNCTILYYIILYYIILYYIILYYIILYYIILYYIVLYCIVLYYFILYYIILYYIILYYIILYYICIYVPVSSFDSAGVPHLHAMALLWVSPCKSAGMIMVARVHCPWHVPVCFTRPHMFLVLYSGTNHMGAPLCETATYTQTI